MKRCLVVDDSRVIRRVALKIVEELGFETAEAGDGREALDACTARLPDAVLLDWEMPVMDGIEFIGELRKMPGGGRVVVVFCTTHNKPNYIQQALDAGADEYIMKPFDSEIVRTKFVLVGLIA